MSCVGRESIQHEINNIIKGEFPNAEDWTPRIMSDKFREIIRLKLRKLPGHKWCDYREGECVCGQTN